MAALLLNYLGTLFLYCSVLFIKQIIIFQVSLMFPSGAIQVLRNAVRGGMVSDFPEKKTVRFNVISV